MDCSTLLNSFYQLDSNCQPVSYVFNSECTQFAFDELENLIQCISSVPGSSENANVNLFQQQQQQQSNYGDLKSTLNVNLFKSHVHVILKEVLKLKNRPGIHILSFVKVRQGKDAIYEYENSDLFKNWNRFSCRHTKKIYIL